MSPKVQSYSAPWLDQNTPGAGLFTPPADSNRTPPPAYTTRTEESGARRTIVHRGTEVFVAVRKEIRWGDLAYLRERYEESPRVKKEDAEEVVAGGVRTLKLPIADDIRQLVLSPNGLYIAVLTAYNIHIMVIPDPTHLSSQETAPIKPKFWTLGPTIHVTSKSALASALWHPLGVDGHCIVTVTTDAIVRLWEISPTDRWSFDSPTLSIDLRKLADGRSIDDDFSATAVSSVAPTSVFSPDSVEMAVAAAAFAERGSSDWAPLTLWVAMREGDVYALCPLLPSKWSPHEDLVRSLSVATMVREAALEGEASVSPYKKLLVQNQLDWITEIQKQDPDVLTGPLDRGPIEVYARPSKPGAVPRLQGPFQLRGNPNSEDELDHELTDIMVIGKTVGSADLLGDDDDDDKAPTDNDIERDGLSLTVVLVLSTSGQARAYLDINGVEAQWLPPRKASASLARAGPYSLLAFQSLDTMTPPDLHEGGWPLFSPDPLSRFSFYVSHHRGISFVSLSSWVYRLESDLGASSEAGTDFRIGLLAGSRSIRDKLYDHFEMDSAVPLAAAVAIRDPDLGYFLLSATPYGPVALTFEAPSLEEEAAAPPPQSITALVKQESASHEEIDAEPLTDFYEPRPAFRPSHVFDQPSNMPTFVSKLRSSRHKTMLNQEVRLSPATLQIFTETHKVLSDETHRLGIAAAEVFRRCELLKQELERQISKVAQVKAKVDGISGGQDSGESDEVRFNKRLARADERQVMLMARLEKMRDTVGRGPPRPLSDKERAFAEELRNLEENVVGTEVGEQALVLSTGNRPEAAKMWRRLEEVNRLQAEITREAESILKAQQKSSDDDKDNSDDKDGKESTQSASSTPVRAPVPSAADLRIPNEIRKQKMQQVRGMLDRETALVEAVGARLERLSVGTL